MFIVTCRLDSIKPFAWINKDQWKILNVDAPVRVAREYTKLSDAHHMFDTLRKIGVPVTRSWFDSDVGQIQQLDIKALKETSKSCRIRMTHDHVRIIREALAVYLTTERKIYPEQLTEDDPAGDEAKVLAEMFQDPELLGVNDHLFGFSI